MTHTKISYHYEARRSNIAATLWSDVQSVESTAAYAGSAHVVEKLAWLPSLNQSAEIWQAGRRAEKSSNLRVFLCLSDGWRHGRSLF